MPRPLSFRAPLVAAVATLVALVVAPVALVAQPKAQPKAPPKNARLIDDVTAVINPRPSFVIGLAADRADRKYYDGDTMRLTLTSESDGYAYVFFRNANDEWSVFYPHNKIKDNSIKAGVPLDIPGAGKLIEIHGPPFGSEMVKAVVTTKPMAVAEAQALFAKAIGAKVAPKTELLPILRAKGGNPKGNPKIRDARLIEDAVLRDPKLGTDWAEVSLEVFTFPKGDPGQIQVVPVPPKPNVDPKPPVVVPEKPRKVGLFVGISQFKKWGRPDGSGDISPLVVGDKDADRMAALAKQHFGLSDALVLTNADATRENIQKAVCELLAQATRPGDLVFIFWSGHGGQCANTVDDGTGPYRQYLVPHDGDLDRPDQTMVLDTTFARWIQNLSGRKVVIVLDTCHSGGLPADPMKKVRPKTITPKGVPGAKPALTKPKFFMDIERSRLEKKIKQDNVFVLASSQAEEASYERRDGTLSVMTAVLADRITGTPGQLSAMDLYEAAKKGVPPYIATNFPGAQQTPVYGGKVEHPPYLRD